MGSKQELFIFLVIIFFPVSFGFLLLTELKLNEKLISALLVSVALAALIAGDA
jgi:hypothetical protein